MRQIPSPQNPLLPHNPLNCLGALMDADVVELKVTLARVLERLEAMQNTIEIQEAIISKQGEQLSRLVSMADQGKGGVWTLIALGGVIGAGISHAKEVLHFLAK